MTTIASTAQNYKRIIKLNLTGFTPWFRSRVTDHDNEYWTCKRVLQCRVTFYKKCYAPQEPEKLKHYFRPETLIIQKLKQT